MIAPSGNFGAFFVPEQTTAGPPTPLPEFRARNGHFLQGNLHFTPSKTGLQLSRSRPLAADTPASNYAKKHARLRLWFTERGRFAQTPLRPPARGIGAGRG